VSTPLDLRAGRRPDGRPVLAARGEIDMTNLAAFRSALASLVAAPPANGTAGVTRDPLAVVDLSAVEYLDSGAINVLFVHADRLHLVCNPVLLPALRISGLTELASVEPAGPPS
jgi:anti-anti-sigma regulatory factor